MKFTTALKAAVISTGMLAGVLYIAPTGTLSSTICQPESQLPSEQCIAAQQQNWLKWFQGDSRSTQFHFVDLLELLSRLSPTK